MPIYFELTVLLLLAYAVGLGIGWLLWNPGLDGEEEMD